VIRASPHGTRVRKELGMPETRRSNLMDVVRSFRSGLLLIILGASGCATTSDNPFTEATNLDAFLLRVESRHADEVSVYIAPGGRRELVGTVPSYGVEFLEFQYPAGRALAIELESRLGDRFRVPPVSFPGGGRVDFVIPRELRGSTFVRR
jgi:hypothetical protein